jgi:alanyl-tRNA synthetase
MEFEKKDGKVIGKLENKNVDTGAGLERITAILQNKTSAYETDLFSGAIEILEKESKKKYDDFRKEFRIILDHLRASVFLISDGVFPDNKDQGYILRRILRRASVKMKDINFQNNKLDLIIDFFIKKYGENHENIIENKDEIKNEIKNEIEKFEKTLERGMKEFEKIIDPENKNNNIKKMEFGHIEVSDLSRNEISADDAFKLVATYGFPGEIIKEEAEKRGLCIDCDGLENKIKDHAKKSSTTSAGKFKGGLGGNSPKIIAFHTATHLMLTGLQKFVSKDIHQKSSNITEERMRFDFNYKQKVERDLLDKVENYVNSAICSEIEMVQSEMDKAEAMKSNVEGSF